MSISKLLDWQVVVSEMEVAKYQRYALFSKAFIRLTPQSHRHEVDTLLNEWIQAAHTEGIDFAISIYNSYCLCQLTSEVELALLNAITVITDGNFQFNSAREIQEAETIALNLYRKSLENIYLITANE